jgi:hypothetical protein
MRSVSTRVLLGALIATTALLLSGCFLRLLFGAVGERETEFGTVFVATIGGTWGPMAICDFDEEGGLVDCSYSFLDFEADPPIIERTSSAELISEFGILGVFIDPLIIQVPAGATNFTGMFDDGAGAEPLVITEVSSFRADVTTEVVPESGHKFVILEFPADVTSALQSNGTLDGPFDFNVAFELPSLSPVEVKAMYTGKVTVNGQTFFPPMLPCVTDFADVPAITLPVSQDPVNSNLMPQILAILDQYATLACNGVVYDYTSIAEPPALEVGIDIKFLSNPNAFNCKKGGVLPVTIFGTADFDVADIDVSSLRLSRADGIGSEVGPPLHWSIFDRGDPADAGVAVDGVDVFNPDGFDDLDAAFDAQTVADLVGCDDLGKGEASPTLVLTGALTDGTSIASSPVADVGIDQLLIQNN